MARKKTGRKELSSERRASILSAARCIFAQQGFSATIVDDIAENAGLAKGTVYLYFRSKEELYMAALLEDARRLDELTRRRMALASHWFDKLRAYVDVRLEYLAEEPDFLRIYLAEFRAGLLRGAPIPCPMHQFVRESEGQIAQIVAAAAARGEIRSVDPEMAARALQDLTRGMLERRLIGWTDPHSSADCDFALELFRRALAPAGV
jgi:AcrR family transcriptional regulator